MSRRDRILEGFLEIGSWVVLPLMIIGLITLVAIETRKQRKQQ